jgi:hypothetical protein
MNLINLLFLTKATATFGRNHIMMAIFCLILIIGLSIAIAKTDIKFETLINIMLVCWVISEFLKTISNMTYLLSDGTTIKMLKYVATDGVSIVRAYLPRTELPFHLCSIQPFFILIVKFTKSEKTKRTWLSFMFPTMLIGAVCSIALDTVGCDFTNPQTYEYFLFHTALIIFAISMITKKVLRIDLQAYKTACFMLLIMFIASIWLNSILSDTGSTDSSMYTNFFYSVKPPLSGLPILNFNHGWGGYFISMVLLGIILVTILEVPFIIYNKKHPLSVTETSVE